jgi:GNAT-family acetyltransferase (TIGR03103 family)
VPGYDAANEYTTIIVDEALRRGITVEIIDPRRGGLRLSFGGRSRLSYESLSELTSAIAFRRCDDKLLTREVLEQAGIPVAPGRAATFDGDDLAFLQRWNDLVVKPARGEQGRGITVGVRTGEELEDACTLARHHWPEVLLEKRCPGQDLRVLVIGNEVVAAAIRVPAAVTGTGADTVVELITELSERRAEATNGAARIVVDERTRRIVEGAGWTLEAVLPEGVELQVCGTANVHTGGELQDVTSELHPGLAGLSLAAAGAVGAPVAGVDLIVEGSNAAEGIVIEVNEQPGLAHHEPWPTAERFVDLLFPETRVGGASGSKS